MGGTGVRTYSDHEGVKVERMEKSKQSEQQNRKSASATAFISKQHEVKQSTTERIKS